MRRMPPRCGSQSRLPAKKSRWTKQIGPGRDRRQHRLECGGEVLARGVGGGRAEHGGPPPVEQRGQRGGGHGRGVPGREVGRWRGALDGDQGVDGGVEQLELRIERTALDERTDSRSSPRSSSSSSPAASSAAKISGTDTPIPARCRAMRTNGRMSSGGGASISTAGRGPPVSRR